MEYITANSTRYECKSITTGVQFIRFIIEGQSIATLESTFREVTILEVSSEDEVVYGTYENLAFESATVYEDATVEVTMHIPTEIELRLANLESTQAEQDEVIAELIGGDANE